MTQREWTKVRRIVEEGVEKICEKIAEDELDVGYWPDDNSAIVDAVMAVIRHQEALDKYHCNNGTTFG